MTDKPQINIRLSQDLHAAVKGAAKTRGISLNRYVVEVLSEDIATISVPLRVVGTEENPSYEIRIPPEWYFLKPILCGQEDLFHNVHLCSDCKRDGIRGCGKSLQ